ncbi:MAG: flavodoxin family protein [Sarcina sp.]
MKIAVIYGSMRKSSTYNIARQFIDTLSTNESEVTEFFLPRDCPNFCRACFKCFDDDTKCPDYKFIHPITTAIDNAELLIFATPVYVYHASGAMKSFLDHLGYRWMVHKPSESMFKKQALVISTAAGGGCKSTNKDLLDNFFFWGVGKSYSYGANVFAVSWDGVSEKNKLKIQKNVAKISNKIVKNKSRIVPPVKTKGLFLGMKLLHKKGQFSENDKAYWNDRGWLNKTKPWK